MIRKYHNHKLQITPWHPEEEPLNHHETPGRQIKQSNQLSLPHQDDCNTRMDTELSLGFWKQEFRTPIWQKVGVPLEKVGVSPTKKSWSPTNLCIPYIFSILAGSDTFE